MSNTNCLKGMQCPNEDCGSFGPYRIAVTAVAEMWDDGPDDPGYPEFTDHSHCQCVMCSHEGSVSNFRLSTRRKHE
jgi:hypothetical protein